MTLDWRGGEAVPPSTLYVPFLAPWRKGVGVHVCLMIQPLKIYVRLGWEGHLIYGTLHTLGGGGSSESSLVSSSHVVFSIHLIISLQSTLSLTSEQQQSTSEAKEHAKEKKGWATWLFNNSAGESFTWHVEREREREHLDLVKPRLTNHHLESIFFINRFLVGIGFTMRYIDRNREVEGGFGDNWMAQGGSSQKTSRAKARPPARSFHLVSFVLLDFFVLGCQSTRKNPSSSVGQGTHNYILGQAPLVIWPSMNEYSRWRSNPNHHRSCHQRQSACEEMCSKCSSTSHHQSVPSPSSNASQSNLHFGGVSKACSQSWNIDDGSTHIWTRLDRAPVVLVCKRWRRERWAETLEIHWVEKFVENSFDLEALDLRHWIREIRPEKKFKDISKDYWAKGPRLREDLLKIFWKRFCSNFFDPLLRSKINFYRSFN